MKVRLSAAADDDINRILADGLQQFGQIQVAKYLDELQHLFRLIGDFPEIGALRPEAGKGLRVHPFQSHMIVYVMRYDEIEILRIRDGSEDWLDD